MTKAAKAMHDATTNARLLPSLWVPQGTWARGGFSDLQADQSNGYWLD